MNSLGSWIDKGELDRLVAAVGTGPLERAEAEAAADDAQNEQKSSWPRSAKVSTKETVTPPTDDTEKFPIAEEVEKFRDKVAAIKDKARTLGVLRPSPQPPAVEGDQLSDHKRSEAPTAPRPPSIFLQTQAKTPKADSTSIQSSPAPTRPPKPDTGPLAAKAPPPRSLPEFTPPTGSLPEQFEAYGKWVVSLTHAQAIIISDAQGDLLYAHGADASWCNAVTTAATAAEQIGRQLSIPSPNVLHLDLPGDRKLAVLQLKLRSTSINIGMVVSRQLDPDLSLAIAGTLARLLAK